jgi:hypothetical protein
MATIKLDKQSKERGALEDGSKQSSDTEAFVLVNRNSWTNAAQQQSVGKGNSRLKQVLHSYIVRRSRHQPLQPGRNKEARTRLFCAGACSSSTRSDRS